jgi:hypothetical protein
MNEETYQPIEVAGIKYLPIDVLITSNRKSGEEAKKAMKECGAIYQRVKKLDVGGFFGKAHAVLTVLVPETNVIKFNEMMSDD